MTLYAIDRVMDQPSAFGQQWDQKWQRPMANSSSGIDLGRIICMIVAA